MRKTKGKNTGLYLYISSAGVQSVGHICQHCGTIKNQTCRVMTIYFNPNIMCMYGSHSLHFMHLKHHTQKKFTIFECTSGISCIYLMIQRCNLRNVFTVCCIAIVTVGISFQMNYRTSYINQQISVFIQCREFSNGF